MLFQKFSIIAVSLALLNRQASGSTWAEQGTSLISRPQPLSIREVEQVRSTCHFLPSDSPNWDGDVWDRFPYAVVELKLRWSEAWEDACDDRISKAIAKECAIIIPANRDGYSPLPRKEKGHCDVTFYTTSDPQCALYALCSLEQRGVVPRQCEEVGWIMMSDWSILEEELNI